MNFEVTKRIKEYLEMDTDYAVIINGNYGVGKTHFIKNSLMPYIKKTKVTNTNNNKPYEPIFISLFGIKSVDDFQDKIIAELYPVLEKKSVKFLKKIADKTSSKLTGVPIIDTLLELGRSSESLIDYKSTLIIIDDIDRRSEKLAMQEIIGFINNLVENLKAKVIIIANEVQLIKESDTKQSNIYTVVKEKVIGITISFKTEVSGTFYNIIKKYELDDKYYYDFLSEHNEIIVKRISQNNDNLRNLLFFLEHFKIIFIEINKFISNPDSRLYPIKDNILETILNFTLPISIEYKKGYINSDNYLTIKNDIKLHKYSYSVLGKYRNNLEWSDSFIDMFFKKYFLNDKIKFIYFNSIFYYINGIKPFSKEDFSNELYKLYKLESDKISETEKIIKKLDYWNCVDLNEKDYESITMNALQYVDEGKFSLKQYPIVFHFATRFKNLLNVNIDELITRFQIGILKGKGNYQHEQYIMRGLHFDEKTEFFTQIKEIAMYCEEINQQTQENKEITSMFNLFSSDFDTFIEKAQYENKQLTEKFFIKFDFNKIWEVIISLKNSQIIEFAYYINETYMMISVDNRLSEFLKRLQDNIEVQIKEKSELKLTVITFEFFKEKIQEVLNKFTTSNAPNNA